MKLLLVINSLILAGAEVLVRQLAPRLRAQGVDVTLLVLQSLDGPLETELRSEGFRFLPQTVNRIYSIRQVSRLATVLDDFNLVHVHLFPAQLWTPLAKILRRSHVKLITSEHGTNNNRRRFGFQLLDRWIYNRYDAITCNSEATAASLRAWLPELKQELKIIPNGIDLEHFSTAPAADMKSGLGLGDVQVITFVARMQAAKDHATLLRALTKVAGAHCMLIGDGELRPQLEALGRKLGIGPRMHFLGRRSDVAQLLKMSDVYVHPVHYDGFGMAALEAMAAGVPVVASRVPGLADVVGDAGVLVPPQDSDALADALSGLLNAPERRRELAQAGKARAAQFSIDAMAHAYLELYRSVLNGER